MRFLLVILVWICIVGGLWAYIQQREHSAPAAALVAPQPKAVTEQYSLVLTPTFSAEADPFALQTGEAPAPAVELRVNGTNLSLEGQPIKRGTVLRLAPLPGLVMGRNEIFIQASPPADESSIDHAIRVQVDSSGTGVVDQTLWSRRGSLVSGTINLMLEAEEEAHDH